MERKQKPCPKCGEVFTVTHLVRATTVTCHRCGEKWFYDPNASVEETEESDQEPELKPKPRRKRTTKKKRRS